MMSGLASRFSHARGRADGAASAGVGFAMKLIGIGICAGLGLTCFQFLIDAFFRTIR